MAFLGDVLLQYLRLGGLGVAEIHHLIQKLVYHDEVIPDALFFELFEVFCEDLHYPVQEEQDLSGVGVAFCEGEQVEVVVADVEVVYAFVGEAGWDGRGLVFGFAEEDGEFLDGGHGDVAAVVAGEERLAFEVEEEEGGGHGGVGVGSRPGVGGVVLYLWIQSSLVDRLQGFSVVSLSPTVAAFTCL